MTPTVAISETVDGTAEAEPPSDDPTPDPDGRSNDVPALGDADLAVELSRLAQGTAHVLIIANAFTVFVLFREDSVVPWRSLAAGEFGDECRRAVKPMLRSRLMWASVSGDPTLVDSNAVEAKVLKTNELDGWLKHAADLTFGRKGEVTQAIKNELEYLAGWRCQFSGCGRDLGEHGATGARGRFSYFAHIIAASPDGPRGHPVLSEQLASNPENFLLLCDECHRKIDKIQPAAYTVEMLREMRENSIAEVKRLLDTLRFPLVETVAVIGNIAGQPAQFSINEAREALWGAGLRTEDAKPARYFDPGGQHHDVHSVDYWNSLYRRRDLAQLQSLLDGTHTGTARPQLAVFPQHSTSVLLMAGRVLGDTAGIHLFQPHRDQPPGVSRWAWPTGEPIPPTGKYKVETLREPAGKEEAAVLIVALTWDVAMERMPEPCAAGGQLLLPALRISGPTFDPHCIKHPHDLMLLGNEVDRAMRTLQDEWGVRTVHLFVCAPTSAVIKVGQKMQARHQADYVLYEALPGGPSSMYKSTIELTSLHVRELITGRGSYLLQT